ncbi:hypothetical protein AGR8A_pTi10053 [Agrobacterium fabrum str. J-07]|uniref:RNaseH domain-containing protein n=1 Tax=Agrobacterium fabrum TaxID=1176649 RepID=UPI0009D0D874|nr:RNaseH domain-containing protein [Agrobacterium fabrum]CUX56972.1 hypothetical protein AGR8A_pTi10053 [Agrobacterium fabrum str. J-07]
MTTDQLPNILYRGVKGGRSGGRETVVSALQFDGDLANSMEGERVSWAPRAAALMKELGQAGDASGREQGYSLPYASLRASIASQVPEAVVLERDLGRPWLDQPRALMDAPTSDDLKERLGKALSLWIGLALRPWASRVGAPETLVDAIDVMAADAFVFQRRAIILGDALSSDNFAEARDAIIDCFAKGLENKELFEGLGPVWRIVRGRNASNQIDFITWPSRHDEALYSMVASITVETLPFSAKPIATVRASRRRWMPELPSGRPLIGQRNVNLTLMAKNGPKVCLEVPAPVRLQQVQDPIAPEFLGHLLNMGADIGADLAEQVGRGAHAGQFFGIAYSPRFGTHPIGAGVSTRDQIDLFDAVLEAMDEFGFVAIPFEETATTKQVPKRAEELHKALETEALLSDIAIVLGRNDLADDASIQAAWDSLDLREEGPAINALAASKAQQKLAEVRSANAARVLRAFGERKPSVVGIARSESERRLLESVLRSLFGNSIEVATRPLPSDVHGSRATLPSPESKSAQRFEARVASWRPLAEVLGQIEGGCHALVQANDWYEGRPDDPVNKPAGRYALAAEANANVQYLRPRSAGQRGFANYLHRIQAATYDLIFGHAGLVSDVANVVADAFGDSKAKPTSLIGISVLAQARTRLAAKSAKLCVATRIDCETGRTTARVGWYDGQMKWSVQWEPLFEALKRIASPSIKASLGVGLAIERASFQAFIGEVLDDCVEVGDRPLVMIDSTGASSLWPWLKDGQIASEITLGSERLDASRRWPGVRIVRVRLGNAARIAERKTAEYCAISTVTGNETGEVLRRYCPTVVSRSVKLSSTDVRAHYWATAGYFQMSLPRGLSVYRRLMSLVPAAKAFKDAPQSTDKLFVPVEIPIYDVSYRLPNPIEITVAKIDEGDDADRIAHLVASLRYGYGHTASSTSLPAPLSFESKARDYMTRFALDLTEEEDDEAAEVGDVTVMEEDSEAEERLDEIMPGIGGTPSRAWNGLLANKTGVTVLNNGMWPADNGTPAFKPPVLSAMAAHLSQQPRRNRSDVPEAESIQDAQRWSELSPVIRLPAFVTEEWLAKYVQVPNAQLRAIHQLRAELFTLTGFNGWVEVRPDHGQFISITLQGLRYPRFAAAISQIARRSMAPNKARSWSPFNPLWRQTVAIAKSAGRENGSPGRPSGFMDLLEIALKGNEVEVAKAQVVLGAYEHPFDDAIIRGIESDDRLREVWQFAADAADHLFRSDYEWSGDIRRFGARPDAHDVRLAPNASFDVSNSLPYESVQDPDMEHASMIGTNPVDSDFEVATPEAGHGSAVAVQSAVVSIDGVAEWRRSMSIIRQIVEKSVDPDASILSAVEAQLKEAQNALVRYEASRPRGVEAEPYRKRAQLAFDYAKTVLQDANVDGSSIRAVPLGLFVPIVEQEKAAWLEAILDEAEEQGRVARAKMDEATEIVRQMQMGRLQAAAVLTGEAVDGGQEAVFKACRVLEALTAPSADEHPKELVQTSLAFQGAPVLDNASIEAADPDASFMDDAFSLPAIDGWDSSEDLDESLPVEDAGLLADELPDLLRQGEDAQTQADSGEIPPDPMGLKLTERFEHLVSSHRFGLAFHLATAAQSAGLDGDFPISLPELKLAAFTGHLNHAAHQGSPVVHDLVAEAALALESVDENHPATTARRIIGLASLAPLSLFHSESDAKVALETLRQVGTGLGEAVHAFREALAAPLRSGIALTPSLLRLAREDAQDDEYTRILATRILGALDEFEAKRYKFQLGNKLRQALTNRDGTLGNLRERISRSGQAALEAAREFASEYQDRTAIIHLLEETEKRIATYKLTGIDGIAREKLVGLIQGLAQLCAEYVESADAAPAMKGMRANIQRVTSRIVEAIDGLDATLCQFVPHNSLEAAAADFARGRLAGFKDTLNGVGSLVGPTDHMVALHGQLLWLPSLDFGQGWYPAPYAPEAIVAALISATPQQVFGPADPQAFTTEVRSRMAAGSHIAASMMIEIAAAFDLPVSEIEAISELRLADVETRRDALDSELRDARLMVDRVQRMGGVGSLDEAQSLLSLLDRISPQDLPEVVPLDARTEATEGEQILDFRAAYGLVADVRSKVDLLLTRPRDQLLQRLTALETLGTTSVSDLDTVRGLVQRDDLLTATEYVEFLENGRGLPETTSPNPRYRAYFPKVPDLLMPMSRTEQDRILTAIENGEEFAGLNFGRVPGDRRPEVLETLNEWNELKRAVASSRPETEIASRVVRMLERFGLEVKLRSPNPRGNRRFYTVDMHVDLLLDSSSVLLPDFGSLTGGNYRFCIGTKMPSDTEVAGIEADAGALRIIFLVTETVSTDRRRQLHLSSLESSKRLLVIDESIVYFALSETEFRGLTLFELAQPFSFADPYLDYGNAAVPREMFFGRAEERRKLLEPHGSCIVFGGRRLGKTALLRHLQVEEDDPEAGTAVAYVNINDIGANAGQEQIWESMSRELRAIFSKPVEQSERFSETIRQWLSGDSKRRILVLLDESDRFIQADATKDFAQFIRLQRLMDDTNRRFKFVLAGLHNVTRLVHTENPPLKQIASDPQRIGPLMDDELGDAEALVTRPLAGMGYEFESREDVWRILSYCNYYPVLVQKFCKGLVGELVKETVKKRRTITAITSDHVRLALENETIAKEIGETFDFTISKIEDRYSLIANIVADRALRDSADGRVGEGMTAVEVRDAAASWWPAAFGDANRLSVAEDLLDEMEGLGVLRRVLPDRWALRSPTILRLLGNDDKIAAKLGEFLERTAPPVFDPRSMRRRLKGNPTMRITEGGISPLTLGQEHDLLRDRSPVTLIFGNALSDIAMVTGALASASSSREDKRGIGQVTARTFPTVDALLRDLKGPLSGEPPALLVVHDASPWNASWVDQALRVRLVREGRIRLIFVGQAQHALDWVSEPRSDALSKEVKIIPLQTWSTTLTDHFLHQEHLDPSNFRTALQEATGGFNRLMQQLFTTGAAVNAKSLATRLQSASARRRRDPALPAELGLAGQMYDLFKAIAEYTEGEITPYEIGEGPVAELNATVTGQHVVDFGVMMGLLEPQAVGSVRGEDSRPYRLNPLVRSLLGNGGPQ